MGLTNKPQYNRVVDHNLLKLWERLIDVPDSIQDSDHKRKARLFSSLMLATLPLIVTVGIVIMPFLSGAKPYWKNPTVFPASFAIICTFISYSLNQKGQYYPAAALYTLMFILAPLAAVISDIGPENISIGGLMLGGVLLSSALFDDRKVTLLSAAIVVGGTFSLLVLVPNVTFKDIASLLSMNTTISVLIVAFSYYRDRLEYERRAELQNLYAILEQHSHELEDAVDERTKDLQVANSHLKKLSQIKDEFVSNVSHELRTPITSLNIHLDLLQRQPERMDYLVGILERETKRLNHIIEDLLRLSRLDQGREKLDLKTINIADFVGLHVSDRKTLFEKHQLTLSINVLSDIVSVSADEGLFSQVLSILLTNALNYTPPGGTVQVVVETQKYNGMSWGGFSVQDTGMGISQEDQPRLFERFFRGSYGESSSVPGTGLGLAIAKEIVEHHHGRIEVASPGANEKGATFSVWLPIAM